MPVTIVLILAVIALIVTIAHALGRAPLWIAVLLLCLIALLQSAVPLR